MNVGFALRPFHHGRFCGDQCAGWTDDTVTNLCLIDGLGHGEGAEIAAKSALEVVGDNRSLDLPDIFYFCDEQIRETRGVAMGIARYHHQTKMVEYAAVGNTRACIFGMEDRYLGSTYGIIGEGKLPDIFIEKVDLSRTQTLALWSDGMAEAINIRSRLRSHRGDFAQLAGDILDEFKVPDDDGSLLLARLR